MLRDPHELSQTDMVLRKLFLRQTHRLVREEISLDEWVAEIRKILKSYTKYSPPGMTLIFADGSSGPVDVSSLRSLPVGFRFMGVDFVVADSEDMSPEGLGDFNRKSTLALLQLHELLNS
jgi:hypothetical protein